MQLRPHIQYYELSAENHRRALKYNLDISLFERLSATGVLSASGSSFQFPYARLTVQRRMRPDIADLVRLPLYPELLDHACVQHYPRVSGMYHNLFWFHHTHPEDGSTELDIKGMSHSNNYEVQMVKQLVTHLSRQGCYGPGEIAIVTPYLGQVRKLKIELGNTFAVYLTEKDQEEVDAIDELMESTELPYQSVERKPLSQTVRMATVFSSFNGCNGITFRSTIFKEKKLK